MSRLFQLGTELRIHLTLHWLNSTSSTDFELPYFLTVKMFDSSVFCKSKCLANLTNLAIFASSTKQSNQHTFHWFNYLKSLVIWIYLSKVDIPQVKPLIKDPTLSCYLNTNVTAALVQ